MNLAMKVAEKIEDKKVALDPTMIATIIAILGAIFELYVKCKQTPAVSAVGPLERWHLRRAIKAKLNDSEMYHHIGHDVYAGILSLPQEEVDKEFEAYQNAPVTWGRS